MLSARAGSGAAPSPVSGDGHRLDEAISSSVRARVEAARSHASLVADLEVTFGPHGQAARTKGRAMLNIASRATARLAAALQLLEAEAANEKRAHSVALLSARRAFADQVAQIELERREEKAAFDMRNARIVQHAEHLSGKLASAEASAESGWKEATNVEAMLEEAGRAHDLLKAEASRTRSALEQCQGELRSERAVHALEVERLRQANEAQTFRASEQAADFEQVRRALAGEVERLAVEKEAATNELAAQLARAHSLRQEEVSQLHGHIDGLVMERKRSESALHDKLVAEQVERESEQRHHQVKLDRLAGLHQAVLSAGSARGRQLLYAEHLRRPDNWGGESITWRGEEWRHDI